MRVHFVGLHWCRCTCSAAWWCTATDLYGIEDDDASPEERTHAGAGTTHRRHWSARRVVDHFARCAFCATPGCSHDTLCDRSKLGGKSNVSRNIIYSDECVELISHGAVAYPYRISSTPKLFCIRWLPLWSLVTSQSCLCATKCEVCPFPIGHKIDQLL